MLNFKIIQKMDSDSVMTDEQLVGDEGEIILCEYTNSVEEAERLIQQIKNWVDEENIPLSEIAILISKQADLYAQLIMKEFEKHQIPYRNEQQLQDISTEPITRLIIDYLLCLYGEQEPNAWIRLKEQLIPFAGDEELEFNNQYNFQEFFKEQKRKIKQAEKTGNRFSEWVVSVKAFLKKISYETMVALSPTMNQNPD